MKILLTFGAILGFFMIAPQEAWSSQIGASKDPVSRKDFERSFSVADSDSILETLTAALRQMLVPENVLPFLKDVWERNTNKYPHLSWRTLDDDLIRLRLANVLLQARRNRLIEFDASAMQTLSREKIRAREISVSHEAIRNLAYFDDPQDVEILLSLATEEDPRTYRPTVLSLIFMCIDLATAALDRLQTSTTNEEMRLYLIDARDRVAALFQKTGASWCPKVH